MERYMKITANHTQQSIRFESGLTVYDEALYDDRYITRYWSPAGQILPEMHLEKAQFISCAEGFPLDAFSVSINGTRLVRFSMLGHEETADESGLFSTGPVKVWKTSLRSREKPIEIHVCTRLDGSRFLVRWLEIRNCADEPVGIDSVYPLSGRVWLHNGKPFQYPISMKEVSDKADFDIAYCRSTEWGCEGDFYFDALPKGVFRFDGGKKGRSGWSRPAFWLRDNQSGQIMAVEFAYSGNWEFAIQNQAAEKTVQAGFEIGIPAIEGEYIRVLKPGEQIRTPAVHAALFPCCGLDEISQSFHEHIRNTVMPKAPLGREVEIEANHRGYLCDRENEEGILADVDVAFAAGAEMYVVDAGWFGPMPNHWWDNVGDWYYGSWLPRGLKPIAEYVHQKGMKFGLWIEIEAIGAQARLGQKHPEWRMRRGDAFCAPYEEEKGEGGRALDLSRADVTAWLEETISGYIEELGLDMYRIDHNHCMGLGGYRDANGMRENVLWRYYENFYALHKRLREKYPAVVFQNCAGGGGRLDLGMLNCFHNTEASDWARPPRVGKIFNNLSMILPPEKMLCIFGTETLGLEQEYDLTSQLCAVLGGRPIFRGIAPSIEEINPQLLHEIRENVNSYKEWLRPVLRECVVYHHTPMLPLFEPAQYSVMEYSVPSHEKGFLLIRRLASTFDGRITVFPRSVDPNGIYRICRIHKKQIWTQSGFELVRNGLISEGMYAEIITFEQLKQQ